MEIVMRNLIIPLALAGAFSLWVTPAIAHEMEEQIQPPAETQAQTGSLPEKGEKKPVVKSRKESFINQWDGNISLYLGGQAMQDSGWKNNDEDVLVAGGLALDFGHRDWPINLYLGAYNASYGKGGDMHNERFSLSTAEFGPRYYFTKTGSVRPYISGGVAVLSANRTWDQDRRKETENVGDTVGGFANAGIMFKLGKYVNLGLDVTAVGAGKLEYDKSGSYVRFGLTLGGGLH